MPPHSVTRGPQRARASAMPAVHDLIPRAGNIHPQGPRHRHLPSSPPPTAAGWSKSISYRVAAADPFKSWPPRAFLVKSLIKSVEATLKNMSAVRERIQMNRIKHDLAMRKLLGDDWRARVRPGGGDDMMWIEADAEENCGRGEREVRVMRFRDRDGRELMHRERLAPGECCPARGTREFKILRARSGRAACHADGARKNNWDSRMFRPRGKGTDRCCSGDCRHMECRHRSPEECRRAMNPAELRLWERNSTVVIFLAIRSKSIILLSFRKCSIL